MRHDTYYHPHAADPVLDDAQVLGLVRRHVPRAAAVTGVDETGGEARVYDIDDNLVLKVQRPHRVRDSTSLDAEALFLCELERQTDVPVPRVLGYDAARGLEYILMTRIPGVPVKDVTWEPAARAAMLTALGQTLRRVHDLDQERILDARLIPIDSPADLRDRLREDALANISRARDLTPATIADLTRYVDSELARIDDTGEFVAIHTNPATTHTFVDPATRTYQGLIDFADTYIGHPVFDLWTWHPADRAILYAGYTADAPVTPAFQTIYDVSLAIDVRLEAACGPVRARG